MKWLLLLIPLIASAKEKTNIVYINADDLGWTDLGVQGSTYYETPHLDKLAASGARFTNGYAAASNCAPSRACAMSGQWPQRHGIYTVSPSDRGESQDRKLIPIPNTKSLADEVFTIPELLKEAGYYTAHVGKWHLTADPRDQGFDLNIAGFHGGLPAKGGYHSPYHYANIVNQEEGEYLTDRLADEAAAIIKKQKDKPFFLSFTPYTVHTPIEGRADLVEKFSKKEGDERHNHPEYAAMVASLDLAVGRIVEALTEEGLLENTFIVFTSDNGGHSRYTSNAPLRSGKGSYYEGGIREPFFFAWPGRIESGLVLDTPITNLDLFPTFAAIAEAQIPPEKVIDGQNLLPLLTENTPLPSRDLFWHFPIYLEAYLENDQETRDPIFRTRPGSVIRSGNWKLHHYFEDDGIELYDLANDPSEQANLAEKHPEKVARLRRHLSTWLEETNAPLPTEPNPEYQSP